MGKKKIRKELDKTIRQMRLDKRTIMRTWNFPFNLISECIDDKGDIK